jgi:hypothetical protein
VTTVASPTLPPLSDRAALSEVLGMVERREATAISWGFYDLAFTARDLEHVLDEEAPTEVAEWWQKARHHGADGATLLSDMEEAGLVYRLASGGGQYRTRFAEGVRLIARLRQLFTSQQWSTGPSLVSDIKVHLAPRRYPRRTESAAQCWGDLEPHCRRWSRLQSRVFHALATRADSHPMQFAGFQRRAFAHVLSRYGARGLGGTMVSAGTGAGKTKAFYIPALLGVAADVAADARQYTKVIAIYPRNVLLADQLREALSEVAKIQPVLEAEGVRPLTIGALLGGTPDPHWFVQRNGAPTLAEQYGHWRRTTNGWVIPYVQSPVSAGKELVWRDGDRLHGRTALYRADGAVAAPDVPDGTLVLTREQLQANPPDVLFLSLEMVNQHMGNPAWRRTFGLDEATPKPRLLLLDEVHTYEGIPGAQAAWVLRRWRHWGGIADLHVVGLSATVNDGPGHLARVAGLAEPEVREFRPLDDELTAADMEYNLLVKGNPAAGASLLATSIQTAMLLTRLLTPANAPAARSNEVAGSAFFARKVFGFTDKLDVVNRWYSDLRDAEERRRLARLRIHPNDRAPAVPLQARTVREMDAEGQIWELPARLGHNLAQALRVDRCSSQDPGMNAGADLIVATSSLEVGFDDPEVGATLHHKSPRSFASFVQRKGRAGRRPGTRPWTVVVLSDYGADRWAFQSAEQLFRPEVDAILLPLANSHVLRVQAAFFLIDWIGRRINEGNPYEYLRAPTYGTQHARERSRQLLQELLAQGPAWWDFRHELHALFRYPRRGARPLGDEDIDSLLWEPPRPLMRHALPSLLRKIEAGWRYADPARADQTEDADGRRPLPLFIPGATFAELEVGEARILFPEASRKTPQFLSVARALAETCPGNVSKRYSIGVRESGYWLAFSPRLLETIPPERASVAELFPDRLFLDAVDGVSVYQPQTVPVIPLDERSARDTSSARWQWETRIRTNGGGQHLPIFHGPAWAGVVRGAEAYLHRDYASLDVLRYARGCRYEVRRPRVDARVGRLAVGSAAENGDVVREEAVGFREVADGLVVRIAPEHLATLPPLDEAVEARFRAEYFLERLRTSEGFSDHVSSFLREWLWQVSMAMLVATAAKQGSGLAEAQAVLAGRRSDAARKVLESIFQVRDVDIEGAEEAARLKTSLQELWNAPDVVREVERLEQCLWEPLTAEFEHWVRRRYVATLAQAIRAAAVSRLAEVSEDDLAVDVSSAVNGGADIYLTETSTGGIGLIELVVEEMRRAPDAFHEGVHHHLAWCPREDVARDLLGILRNAQWDSGRTAVRDAFTGARSAVTYADAAAARNTLRAAVADAGYVPTRPLIVALLSRVLQPGTSPGTDALLDAVNAERTSVERRIGVGVDARVFAYHCLSVPALREPLEAHLRHVADDNPSAPQLYAIMQRFVFDGCADSCPECLDQPQQFVDMPKPSRALARHWLGQAVPEVSVNDGDWVAHVRATLLQAGRVKVLAPADRIPGVADELQAILAEELESSYLLLPPALTRVEREGAIWKVTLELKETIPG